MGWDERTELEREKRALGHCQGRTQKDARRHFSEMKMKRVVGFLLVMVWGWLEYVEWLSSPPLDASKPANHVL